jgi:hypothetical protein
MPTQCDAITRSYTLCRGYAETDALCHKHRNWYKDELWSRALQLYATQWYNRRPKTSIRAIMYIVERAIHRVGAERVEYYLEYGLRGRAVALHIYSRAVDTGLLKPTIHRGLWMSAVKQKLQVLTLSQVGREDDITEIGMRTHDVLEPYVLDASPDILIEVAAILLSTWHMNTVIFDRIFFSALPLFNLKELTFLHKNEYYSLMAKRMTYLKSLQNQGHMPITVEQAIDSVRIGIDMIKVTQRKVIKTKIAPFKEELMMVAWHPSRVQKILEAGGYELLDSY